MSSDRLIVEAIKMAHGLLRQNLPPMHSLTDAATVLRLRELVNSPSIRSALDRSNDTILAFALRAVERVLCDHVDYARSKALLLEMAQQWVKMAEFARRREAKAEDAALRQAGDGR